MATQTSNRPELPDSNNTTLYSFIERDQKTYGAPVLVPKSGTGIINVTRDYPWTKLPPNTRSKVPSITLTEYRVTSSTLVQSFIQQARSAVDALGNAGGNLADAVKKGVKILGFNVTDGDISGWLSKNIYANAHGFLDPYKHLYPVEPTKWSYVLPFLTGQNQGGTSSWSTTDNSDVGAGIKQAMVTGIAGGFVGDLLNALEVGGKASKIFNLMEPGSHTETIKHYSPTETEGYKISFV